MYVEIMLCLSGTRNIRDPVIRILTTVSKCWQYTRYSAGDLPSLRVEATKLDREQHNHPKENILNIFNKFTGTADVQHLYIILVPNILRVYKLTTTHSIMFLYGS